MNHASLSVLAAVDLGLLFGQLPLFYAIEVFFFLGHGSFEGRILPSGLASRSSWVDVSTVVRVIGLVTYIQVDALDFFSFVAPGRRWKVLCSWLCTWLERFIRFGLRKPCPRVQLDCPESRNQVFNRCGLLWSRAGLFSWPSPLRFPPVLRERPQVFLVRPTFSERRRPFPSSGLVSRCRQ
ncbi:hypothetical protein F2Q70_00018139 [Brassica cretica]|uniref:Uncharacterized protein n=1 Tax=Brassica cretica TaxID=69181 RepID=A0A8S9I2D8_BRACR|nr:hypothetical protein F2Q70_00018139 [Brassica cretica]